MHMLQKAVVLSKCNDVLTVENRHKWGDFSQLCIRLKISPDARGDEGTQSSTGPRCSGYPAVLQLQRDEESTVHPQISSHYTYKIPLPYRTVMEEKVHIEISLPISECTFSQAGRQCWSGNWQTPHDPIEIFQWCSSSNFGYLGTINQCYSSDSCQLSPHGFLPQKPECLMKASSHFYRKCRTKRIGRYDGKW